MTTPAKVEEVEMEFSGSPVSNNISENKAKRSSFLSQAEKQESMELWDKKNFQKQQRFFGRDHRSIDKGRRGSVAIQKAIPSDSFANTGKLRSGASSSSTANGKLPERTQESRRSSTNPRSGSINGNLKKRKKTKRNRRNSITALARSQAAKRNKRKHKVCCLLRSNLFLQILTAIFGERFDVDHKDMHLLASPLSGKQRDLAICRSLLLFFMAPIVLCAALWSIPMMPLKRSMLNITNTSTSIDNISNFTPIIGPIVEGPISTNTSPIYMWCTLPLTLSSLATVPAMWFHKTTNFPIIASLVTSLLSMLIPGLASAHLVGMIDRQYNILIAMGVGFTSSVLFLTLVAIRYGLNVHTKGGYKFFRAASIIQNAWMAANNYDSKAGIGVRVNQWMKNSAIDEHSVVMDEVSIFRGLNPEVKSRMQLVMQPREFKQGEYICREGEVGNKFYIILKGSVSVRCEAKKTRKKRTENVGSVSGNIRRLSFRRKSAQSKPQELEKKQEHLNEQPQKEENNQEEEKQETVKQVEICRMHGGDYFGEVALLTEDGVDRLRSASVVVLSSTVETFAISSHNFRKSVLPHLSEEAAGRLMRACRRRQNHTAEFRLDHEPLAKFVRKSIDITKMSSKNRKDLETVRKDTPKDPFRMGKHNNNKNLLQFSSNSSDDSSSDESEYDGRYNGNGGSDMSSSGEDDSSQSEEDDVTSMKQRGGRSTRYKSAPTSSMVEMTRAIRKSHKTGLTSELNVLPSLCEVENEDSRESSLADSSLGTRTDFNKKKLMISTSIEQSRRSTIGYSPSYRRSKMKDPGVKAVNVTIENRTTEAAVLEKEKCGNNTQLNRKAMKSIPSNASIKSLHSENSVWEYQDSDSPTRPEATPTIFTKFGDRPVSSSKKGGYTGNNTVKREQIHKRKRNSSLQVGKDKRRNTRFESRTSDVGIKMQKKYVEKRLKRKYKELRYTVCSKALKTGFALLSSFFFYPCFLAYLWGFTEITNSTNPNIKSWAPVYALLVGPLRLTFQTIGEVTLANADQFTARAGGAWTLALGVRLHLLSLFQKLFNCIFK
jgi:CRP-like cAMP-binding protein